MLEKEKAIEKLNEKEIKVYQYILAHSLEFPFMTIRELADKVQVSTTVILNYVKKIGYKSFKEFKLAYRLQERKSREKEPEFDYLVYGLNMPREKLYERINLRVDLMIEQGLIEEVENIYNKYKKFPTAMQGLGYKEVVEYLNGDLTKEEMIEKIKQETRRYAKRQMTWFKKNKQTIWLDTENTVQNNLQIILEGLN